MKIKYEYYKTQNSNITLDHTQNKMRVVSTCLNLFTFNRQS